MRRMRYWIGALVLLFWTACLLPLSRAAGFGEPIQQLRERALAWEASGQWKEASQEWERILKITRNLDEARFQYQRCLRRAQQVRRYQDRTYRAQVQKLSVADALQVYGEILGLLRGGYVDRDRVEWASLYKQGLDELHNALGDEAFCQAFTNGASLGAIQGLRAELQAVWHDKLIRNFDDVITQTREIAFSAQRALGLNPTLVVLEFACGACSGLDEYTYYLTPGQYNEMNASWNGEVIGVGIDLSVDGQKQLYISHVIPDSPAQLKGLKVGDRITRIGSKSTGNMAAEAAAELLKGDLDTIVTVEVITLSESRRRVVPLKRQVLHVPSVSEPRFLDLARGIGYLQVVMFQETTLDELNNAIARLQMEGMKVLILDLRGNPGGLFDVARAVVARFLSAGVIVATQGQGEYNTTYYAHGMNTLAMPLVLLVDGDTASAAEMVAGALKDHQRGRLVGKTTFGKGSIQKVRKLSLVPAGIRMTVAKFYSPHGQPYAGVGVAPHLEVSGPDLPPDLELDPQVQAALDVARPLAGGR
jgi:carboxyl-terminal processing protease